MTIPPEILQYTSGQNALLRISYYTGTPRVRISIVALKVTWNAHCVLQLCYIRSHEYDNKTETWLAQPVLAVCGLYVWSSPLLFSFCCWSSSGLIRQGYLGYANEQEVHAWRRFQFLDTAGLRHRVSWYIFGTLISVSISITTLESYFKPLYLAFILAIIKIYRKSLHYDVSF